MKQTIILPRRKLYEQLLILEDFILEIERFILYDKEHTSIKEYSHNDEFEGLLHDAIIHTITLSNIFFTTKLCNSLEEFDKLLKIQQKQVKEKRIVEFLNHLNAIETIENAQQEVHSLLDFISSHKHWGEDKEHTKEFFKLIDTFHTIILKIIEQPSN